jgi:cell wall-associated NlpC family hydrolase
MMASRVPLLSVILVTALSVACATRSARPEPFPRVRAEGESEPTAEGRAPGGAALEMGPAIVDSALALQGRPYAAGATGPDRFDCSGLVQFVFNQFDIVLPRTVAEQFASTLRIAPVEAAAGDLLFFRISGDKPSHVAIALGDGRFVHAPNTRGVVRVDSLAAAYWRERFQAARRVATERSPQNAQKPQKPVS